MPREQYLEFATTTSLKALLIDYSRFSSNLFQLHVTSVSGWLNGVRIITQSIDIWKLCASYFKPECAFYNEFILKGTAKAAGGNNASVLEVRKPR
jgi:hypothetical protein